MEFYCAGVRTLNSEQTVLFSGCNFRCPYCFNSNILEFKEQQTIREIKKQISKDVIFGGGEPTLQKAALLNLARHCKNDKLHTTLLTNGSKPDVISVLIRDHLIDTVVVDIKLPFAQYDKVLRKESFFISKDQILYSIQKSLEILRNNYIRTIVRTVVVPNFLFRKEDLEKIAEVASVIGEWHLHPFIPGGCVELRYNSIKSPSVEFLRHIKGLCQVKYPGLRIKIG